MGKPHILIIHADQHRFDCIGAYGNSEIQTPNIDDPAYANDIRTMKERLLARVVSG